MTSELSKIKGLHETLLRYGVPDEEPITRPCHDCGVRRGELHLEGCDMETCPRCGHQYICCDCEREYEEDDFEVEDPTVQPSLNLSVGD